MSVEISNKSNRAELKTYFARNAIPTEGNFGAFIDGVLNQREDGVAKPPGSPLSIAPTASDQDDVLDLYRDFDQARPSWTLGLRVDDSGTTRTGLAIKDGAGQHRLFIQDNSGRVGVGTANPETTLDVAGPVQANTGSNPIRLTSVWTNFPQTANRGAEIANDTQSYKTLMLVGNRSNDPSVRRVSVWDRLEVNGTMYVTGRLGVGVTAPTNSIDVSGNVLFNTASNPLRITGGWSGWPDPRTNGAEISNDTGTYRTLMIVGNKSQNGRTRRVSVWDRLEVNGTMEVRDGIEQEAWRSVSYLNGWSRYHASWADAGYYKDPFGIVHLRGMIKGTAQTSGRAVFRLPAGYRPPVRTLHWVHAGGAAGEAAGRADVLTSGDLHVWTSSPAWVSLFDISFRTT